MSAQLSRTLASAVGEFAHPLRGTHEDYDPLLALVGDARFILLGEASHGTHEFYSARAEISKRLIRERGVSAVAVEADWPDAYRVNRYVRADSADADAEQSLAGFRRFPQWMWRNADVLDFVGWLRAHNESRAEGDKVGFYGIDLYSLHASMEAVIRYLREVDPDAARRAARRYGCFDRYGPEPQQYGYAARLGLTPTCEAEVVEQLLELQKSAAAYAQRGRNLSPDAQFFAEQNARLVRNAERYYRAMFDSRVNSWNMRDRHMADTIDALIDYLGNTQRTAKVVVWAHNSHLGDARATEMGSAGELNVGQLVRQRHGDDAVLIGFTTHRGTVTAADDWDEPARRKTVRPALGESYEALFHQTGRSNFYLPLASDHDALSDLSQPRLERAIGVIYRPESERQSHYFQADLPAQFDAVLHYDVTRAVEPLERTPHWHPGEPEEPPETYPTAL
ncbi:MAG TPA: erythromycin esterase family protein [Gemmatimonadaceae bacterium]|nr:erythromycin esterase family protein [Gemmatimonadaceae bacterium]